MNKKGVTLLELVLVLVIISIGAVLAVPRLKTGVDHREAKAALETLRSISHAVRMFEVTKGRLPDDLPELETEINDGGSGTVTSYGTFYLDPKEYAPGYDFCINTGVALVVIRADSRNSNRVLTLTQSAVKGQDGPVTDTTGFLGSSSTPPVCA